MRKSFKKIVSFVFVFIFSISVFVPSIFAEQSFDSSFLYEDSLLMFSTPVSDSDIEIPYTISRALPSFPLDDGTIEADPEYSSVTVSSVSSNSYKFEYGDFLTYRTEYTPAPTNNVSLMQAKVEPDIDLSSYDFSKYNLIIEMSVSYANGTALSDTILIANDRSFFQELGFPKIDDLYFSDLVLTEEANFKYSHFFKVSFIFDDAASIENLLDSYFWVTFPFRACTAGFCKLTVRMILQEKSDLPDTSDSTEEPEPPDPPESSDSSENPEPIENPDNIFLNPSFNRSFVIATFPDSSGNPVTEDENGDPLAIYNVTFANNKVQFDYGMLAEWRNNAGAKTHRWSVVATTLNTDFDSSAGYDLSLYDLYLTWNYHFVPDDPDYTPTTAEMDILKSNDGSLGMANIACPEIYDFSLSELSAYSDYTNTYTDTSITGSVRITDSSVIQSLNLKQMKIKMPIYTTDHSIGSFSVSATLIKKEAPTTSQTTRPEEPDVPGTPEFEFLNPSAVGPYDFPFNFLPLPSSGADVSSNFTVSDYYTVNDRYSFRDYTTKFSFLSMPMHLGYDVFAAIKQSDTAENADFSSSICEHFTVTLPYEISGYGSELSEVDSSNLTFEATFYFQTDYIFHDYLNLISKLNQQYVGFEPFSFSVGNTRIPFDYFILEYRNSSDTLRATLKLDGSKKADRMFIDALRASGSGTARFEFTLYSSDFIDDNALWFGVMQGGFGYIGDNPDTPGTTVVTVDSDRYYQQGYNQGLSDGSDKNYVFGFVNGCFSAVNTFWNTLANGISIGGITLGAIITSIVIIIVLVFVLRKLL